MFLAKKGLSVSQYLENITSPKVPIDELRLLILAGMYHGHIAVIMFDWCWTTGFDLVPMTCEYMFAYAGGVKFLATCSSVAGQSITYGDLLKSVGVSQEGQKKALDLSLQSDDKTENKPKKRRKLTSISRKHSSKGRHSSRTITLPLPFSYCSRTRRGCTSRISK